ncbi:hypothetical protein IVB12_15755 [Bradyrhizobium sp. 179]|uniref:hypothetical protein n=1 Tax=Bradyrhizobium sp. 179 TaxID=2782648 RepID=UPI001FFBA3DF|nr:hypothetical protein [Bradyrhizobium sp. 179]MCK1543371.1 hypothetical protein [Bradyrhizobium sp. 179]
MSRTPEELEKLLRAAEEAIVYLNTCGQRPVVDENREIEQEIAEIVARARPRRRLPDQAVIVRQYHERMARQRSYQL